VRTLKKIMKPAAPWKVAPALSPGKKEASEG